MTMTSATAALRIGIDGLNLANPRGTGIATYGRMVGRTAENLGHRTLGVFGIDAGDDDAMRETLFFERLQHSPPPRTRRWLRRRMARITDRWERGSIRASAVPDTGIVDRRPFQDRMPSFFRIFTAARLFERAHRYFARTGRLLKVDLPEPIDVMHWTYPVPIEISGCPNLYTIHDLVPLQLPYATLDDKTLFHRLIGACVDQSSAIVTVSEASLDSIQTIFPAARGKVINTYQVSDLADGMSRAPSREIVGAFGLEADRYFLFYGAVEPKKNVGRLVEAFLRADTDTPLVLVTGRTWLDEAELTLLNQATAAVGEGRIVKLDYVPQSVLRDLVRAARAVVFPSLIEGFGLPVHEAMLLGTPVLTSTAPALLEITDGAAVHVDPYDVASITAGLMTIDRDEALRRHLRDEGPVVAGRFSPNAYAHRLDDLYRRVVACHDG